MLGSILLKFEVQYSTNLGFNTPQKWGWILHKFEVQNTNLRFNTQIWGSILNKFEVQSSQNLRFNTPWISGSILTKFEVQSSWNLRFNTQQIWGSILLKNEDEYSTNLRFNTTLQGIYCWNNHTWYNSILQLFILSIFFTIL